MNVSAEVKSPAQQQEPAIEGSGKGSAPNLGTVSEKEIKNEANGNAKAVDSEQNGGETKATEPNEDDKANDKDTEATGKKDSGVENSKEEPTEEDLKSMPVRQYLENTVVGIMMQGMQQLVRKRPDDPIAWLSDFLDRNNPKKRKIDQMEEDPAPGHVKAEK